MFSVPCPALEGSWSPGAFADLTEHGTQFIPSERRPGPAGLDCRHLSGDHTSDPEGVGTCQNSEWAPASPDPRPLWIVNVQCSGPSPPWTLDACPRTPAVGGLLSKSRLGPTTSLFVLPLCPGPAHRTRGFPSQLRGDSPGSSGSPAARHTPRQTQMLGHRRAGAPRIGQVQEGRGRRAGTTRAEKWAVESLGPRLERPSPPGDALPRPPWAETSGPEAETEAETETGDRRLPVALLEGPCDPRVQG